MPSFWSAKYSDGKVITEQEFSDWRDVPNKTGIVSMSLLWNDEEKVRLDNKVYTAPTKRAYAAMGRQCLTLVSKTIGYYDGAVKVFYRVNEGTGELSIEKVKNGVLVEKRKG